MDSITARFREIFKRGLYEFAAIELQKPVNEDDDVQTLQVALSDAEYICKDTVDPPLFMAIALTEALEESDEDRVLVRQKGYEIYQNLKRDHSVDHRIKIIRGTLPLRNLVTIDSKDLAPDSVKRRRKEEEQKYLKEQVIIPSQGTPEETLGDLQGSPPATPTLHNTTPPSEHVQAREQLSAPGEPPHDPHFALELINSWPVSRWDGIAKFAQGLSVPDPELAFVKPTLERIKQRLEWIREGSIAPELMASLEKAYELDCERTCIEPSTR